jgi:hypothetical protein
VKLHVLLNFAWRPLMPHLVWWLQALGYKTVEVGVYSPWGALAYCGSETEPTTILIDLGYLFSWVYQPLQNNWYITTSSKKTRRGNSENRMPTGTVTSPISPRLL